MIAAIKLPEHLKFVGQQHFGNKGGGGGGGVPRYCKKKAWSTKHLPTPLGNVLLLESHISDGLSQ